MVKISFVRNVPKKNSWDHKDFKGTVSRKIKIKWEVKKKIMKKGQTKYVMVVKKY
jgi:hypothetical protein